MGIRDGGATVPVCWGSYRPTWLAREHQEATMDQSEVMVGAEDDGGGWPRAVELCGGALWWHGHVSDEGEVVAVRLRHVGWRGR